VVELEGQSLKTFNMYLFLLCILFCRLQMQKSMGFRFSLCKSVTSEKAIFLQYWIMTFNLAGDTYLSLIGHLLCTSFSVYRICDSRKNWIYT
jgi:hypothetical protein